MKHLKFLTIACTLLASISLTSCLDSDSDNDSIVNTAIGKLYYTYSPILKTTNGYTITFSPSSLSTALGNGVDLYDYAGEVLYVGYKTSTATIDETAKTISNAEFTGGLKLSHPVEVVYGTAADQLSNDSTATTPIISLKNGSDAPAFMIDNYTLFLPANYTIAQEKNYLTLVYYTEEPEDNNGDIMRLHLRYSSTGSSIGGTVNSYDYTAYNLSYYMTFYDLTNAFQAFMLQNGSYPATVQIVTKENPYSLDLEDSGTTENVYTVKVGN